jgi:hypothetical protein
MGVKAGLFISCQDWSLWQPLPPSQICAPTRPYLPFQVGSGSAITDTINQYSAISRKGERKWKITKSIAANHAVPKSTVLRSANSVSGGKARPILFRLKALVTAILVGLCVPLTPSVAQAPLVTEQMRLSVMTPKQIAYEQVMIQWKSEREYKCLVELVHRESRWNPLAHNKSSGAFGLFQFLPSTWGNYKFPYKPKDASIQITAGLRYIYKRYDTPCEAWSFWQSNARKGNPWY